MSLPELDNDLLYEKKGKIAYMTFNRPSEMNSITPKMMEDIDLIGEDFKNDNELLVLILTGAGDKAFSAGADLKKTITKYKEDADKGARFRSDPTKRFFSGVFKPIISAVNGFCLSGGKGDHTIEILPRLVEMVLIIEPEPPHQILSD